MAAATIGALAFAIAVAILAPMIWEAGSRTAATTGEGAQENEQVLFNANEQGDVVVVRRKSDLFAKEQPRFDAKSQGSADGLSRDHSDVMSPKLQTSVLAPFAQSPSP